VKGIKELLNKVRHKVIGISPIIQGSPIKGPADKLMKYLSLEVSCIGVARYYKDFMGHFVIDERDCELKSEIEKLGVQVYCFDTLMTSQEKKENLAQFVITIKL
jgi:LPPG:FO 2-phospho-L-lactate transferase